MLGMRGRVCGENRKARRAQQAHERVALAQVPYIHFLEQGQGVAAGDTGGGDVNILTRKDEIFPCRALFAACNAASFQMSSKG